MANCAYCGSTIIMGGVRAGGHLFCNRNCHQNAYVLSVSQQVPEDIFQKHLNQVWQGQCPKCQGPGPIDVHKVHEVWSAAIITRWTSKQQLSCRSCGTKRQLGGIGFSALLGWWGFPWGLILTPVQITRNIAAMSGGPDPSRPSADLLKLVRVHLGAKMLAASQKRTTPPPVPPRGN